MRLLRALPLAIVCLAGCGGPGLAGKWNTSGAGMPPGGTAVTEFTGSTFTTTIKADQGGKKATITLAGDYKFDGKKFTQTGKTVKMDIEGLSAQEKAMLPMIQSAMEKQFVKTTDGEGKLEGDTFTVTASGQTVTYTRAK